jgi:hypothetical protein
MVNKTSREITDDLLLTFEFAQQQRATIGSDLPAIKGRRARVGCRGLETTAFALYTLS